MTRNGQVVFADRGGVGAGKGDFPRNVSRQFKANYEKLDWTLGVCATCGKALCDHQ